MLCNGDNILVIQWSSNLKSAVLACHQSVEFFLFNFLGGVLITGSITITNIFIQLFNEKVYKEK